MLKLNIKKLLNEYRELKKKVKNNEISVNEFEKLCKEKYSIVNNQILNIKAA